MKILFLIKENCGYGYSSPKSGLLESSRLTSNQLRDKLGVVVKVVICVDGNSIDRELYLFKPDLCVIEAIWATPEKLLELTVLHPKVKFTIRVHSEIAFLSMEGVAIEWIKKYSVINNVTVSFNSLVTKNDFERIGIPSVYLPNIYCDLPKKDCFWFCKHDKIKTVVDIGCFGSIRPLKNQLLQAMAAIDFGEQNNVTVNFHINGSRIEQRGETVLKNMRAIFNGTKHNLIEHGWLARTEFLFVVGQMDIGLQVSFSESFNLVTADFVYSGVPIIVSEAIGWMPTLLKVEYDVSSIAEKIKSVLRKRGKYNRISKKYLNNYNYMSQIIWRDYLKSNLK